MDFTTSMGLETQGFVTGKLLIMCINVSPRVNDIPVFFFCVNLDRGSPYLG